LSFTYENLWKILENKKISRTEFAKNVGITSATLAKLGKNQNVNMDVLNKICVHLKCELAEIITHTPQSSVRVVSLFSGIGGFEAAVSRSKLNAKTIFASEIDAQASRSYSANFSEHGLFGDITKISEESIPDHDLLVGGFPCQSFSIAGRRHGFEDTRGTLFFDIARIVTLKKPRYLLLENVKNLVGHDDSNTIRVILETLDSLGYTTDFTVINSKEAGLPQSRERTYILSILDYPTEKFELDKRNKKVSVIKNQLNQSEFKGFNFFNSVDYSNKPTTLKDILESQVDDKYFFKSQAVESFLSTAKIKDEYSVSSSICKVFDLPREVHKDHERQRRVYSINGISPTILARADTTKIYVSNKVRKITPIEALLAQGFDREFISNIQRTGISDTQLYKQAGNAVSPPVVEGILNALNELDGRETR